MTLISLGYNLILSIERKIRGKAMKKIIRNRLVGNIISLIILQGSNYIFPLLTFPYLVRVLGVANYGIIIFCVSLMQFLNIFIDYGFDISGTREISLYKSNWFKVNEKYNIIMSIKIFLAFIIGIVFITIVLTIPYFEQNRGTYLLSYLIVLGNVMFPTWLYQGLEQMKYITYMNVITKILVTLMIFIFIKDKNDLFFAILFQTFYYVIPGIISIFFVNLKFNLKFKLVYDFDPLIFELKKGMHIFMTNLWIKFYNQGPALVLGLISNNNAVGNYGIGQKIQTAFSGITQPITQAIYPRICELYEINYRKFNLYSKRLLIYSFITSGILTISLCMLSPYLVYFITQTRNDNIINLVKLFSLIVFLSIVNTVLSRIMYAMNLQKFLNKNYFKAALVFIVLSVPLSFQFKEYGMTIVVIIAQGVVFVFNYFNYKAAKKELDFKKKKKYYSVIHKITNGGKK